MSCPTFKSRLKPVAPICRHERCSNEARSPAAAGVRYISDADSGPGVKMSAGGAYSTASGPRQRLREIGLQGWRARISWLIDGCSDVPFSPGHGPNPPWSSWQRYYGIIGMFC
jgi:hypothetical protein